MPSEAKKGITVKVDAALHAEVKQYLEEHDMTMAEFVTIALTNELHPKIQEKEGKNMEKMRTLAFQVPEDLFNRVKDYLQRNNMTQKEFVIGLIEEELGRDLADSERREKEKGMDEPEETSEETKEAVFVEGLETVLEESGDSFEEAEEENPVEDSEAVSEESGDSFEGLEEENPVEDSEAISEESGDSFEGLEENNSVEDFEVALEESEDSLEETAFEEESEAEQEEGRAEGMDSEPYEEEECENEDESEDEEEAEGMGLGMGM